MPYGTKCGVYEANQEAGTEVSSTYEGRHLTFLESELAHPTHADGFVDKGDPVVVRTTAGDIVGVALKSALAATDLIAIDTEGIWNLSVIAFDDWGAIAVNPGDPLYINTTDLTCTISKRQDPQANTLMGYALGTVTSGQTAVIGVKVHWAPSEPEILMGIATALTTATTGRSAVKVNSDYSGLSGYHVGAWFSTVLTAAGGSSATGYALRGHAETSGVKTNVAPGHYVVGVHGRVKLGGTINGDNLIAAGILGQVIAGGGVLTKLSHLCAIWGDWQEPTEPGTSIGTEILYLSNNSAQRLKQMVYMYGNSGASSGSADFIFKFDSLYFGGASGTPIRDGGLLDLDISTGGVWRKIRIDIDGTDFWLVAMENPTAH